MVIVSDIIARCFKNNFHSGMRRQPNMCLFITSSLLLLLLQKYWGSKIWKVQINFGTQFQKFVYVYLASLCCHCGKEKNGVWWGKALYLIGAKSKNERKGLGGKHPLQGNTPGNPSPPIGSTSNISYQQGRAPESSNPVGSWTNAIMKSESSYSNPFPKPYVWTLLGTMMSTQEIKISK